MTDINLAGISEDIVREGVQLATAEQLDRLVRGLDDVAKELRGAGLIPREMWNDAFDRIVGKHIYRRSVRELHLPAHV